MPTFVYRARNGAHLALWDEVFRAARGRWEDCYADPAVGDAQIMADLGGGWAVFGGEDPDDGQGRLYELVRFDEDGEILDSHQLFAPGLIAPKKESA